MGLRTRAQLGGDGAEGGHVVLPGALGADAAAGVPPVAEVGRAGDDAVDGRGGEEGQHLDGVALQEEGVRMGFVVRIGLARVAQVGGEPAVAGHLSRKRR